MTSLLDRLDSSRQWDTMPGWNVVADLTPPELINLRSLAVLRRRIALGLVLVLVLCAAGFAYARLQNRSARDEADAASARTADLATATNRFGGITRIETKVASVNSDLAVVLANDVDVVDVVAAIRRALPGSMSIQSISVTLSPTGSIEGSTGLNASGRPTVGTVSVSGAGRSLDDLPSFVDGLAEVRGFTDVLPASNTVSRGIATYSVTLALTDRLVSHRYDATTGGR